MTKIITVPLHIGDFITDTMHMDTTEIGAYMLLLLSHYRHGVEGLPDDNKRLARIAGVSLNKFKHMRPTLLEKFELIDKRWVNNKCTKTIKGIEKLSEQNKAKALKRHNSTPAVAVPQEGQPKPKPKTKAKPIDNISKDIYITEFENLWISYPDKKPKGDKQRALKKYTTLRNKGTSHEEIRDGLSRYNTYCTETGSFNKHCTTWLNQDGWKADWEFTTSNNHATPSYTDTLLDIARQVSENG